MEMSPADWSRKKGEDTNTYTMNEKSDTTTDCTDTKIIVR